MAAAGFAHRLSERKHLLHTLHPLHAPPEGPSWNHHNLTSHSTSTSPSSEAAVLVGLIPHTDGTRVLLTRRTDTLRHHPGQISFPGGRLEPGDADTAATALRESNEEIGLIAIQVYMLGYLDPLITSSGFRVTPLVAAIDPAFVPTLQPDEVAEVFEVPLAFLMNPSNLLRVEIGHHAQSRLAFEYQWSGRRIWGITAAILVNLRHRLKECTAHTP
ncbi:DNA mismatch repair protein MutT [Xylella taiwanensis]|nr:DNA mismatch repair protein MutT [Xylella taiwanensis]